MDNERPSFYERMQQVGRTTGLNRGPLGYLAEVATDLTRALEDADAIKQNEAAPDVRSQMIDQAAFIAQQPADNDREVRRAVRTAHVLLTEAAKLPAQPGEPSKEGLKFAANIVRGSVADRIASARERNAQRGRDRER